MGPSPQYPLEGYLQPCVTNLSSTAYITRFASVFVHLCLRKISQIIAMLLTMIGYYWGALHLWKI